MYRSKDFERLFIRYKDEALTIECLQAIRKAGNESDSDTCSSFQFLSGTFRNIPVRRLHKRLPDGLCAGQRLGRFCTLQPY